MGLYCCECKRHVKTKTVIGANIYGRNCPLSYRKSRFFQCVACGNYVGTHANGRPLGCIPTKELRYARGKIHALLDPIWQKAPKGKRKSARSVLYAELSRRLGIRAYHTANIRTIEEARRVYRVILEIKKELE